MPTPYQGREAFDVIVSIRLTARQVERLDEAATKEQRTRSDYLRLQMEGFLSGSETDIGTGAGRRGTANR
jgi:predicted DNA-binding protein